MLSYLDALLIIVALAVFIGGVLQIRQEWRIGNRADLKGRPRAKRFMFVCQYLLSHRRILRSRAKGISHLFVFWGFSIPLIIVALSQFNPHLNAWTAIFFTLVLDLVGALALAGTVYLLLKKYRPRDHQAPSLHLYILVAIFLTGFFAEALRIKITGPQLASVAMSNPVGYGLSFIVPPSPILHKLIIRSHFFLVLLFIAMVPFTNMRHAVIALLNIYYRHDSAIGQLRAIPLSGEHIDGGTIESFSKKDLMDTQACVACGRCDILCPAFLAQQPLSPLLILKELRNASQITNSINPVREYLSINEDIWSCTSCLNCVEVCPIYIDQWDKIIKLRQHAVLIQSNFPKEYRVLFKNIEVFGDSLGHGKLLREEWASQIKITKAYQEPTVDTLLWVGCIASLYSERSQRIAQAAVNILNKSGFRHAILGKQENCCGDPARRLGNEYLFQRIARENIETFNNLGVKRIITFCPHCFNTFKNEYEAFGMNIEVIHAVELVHRLIGDGSLKIKTRLKTRLTYHDPCYLGRYNSLYKLPRHILENALDNNLMEMQHNQDKSICCGAGGGNFWKGPIKGQRIEKIRYEEARNRLTDGIVSSCPFCTLMFESTNQNPSDEKSFQVLDILEIVDSVT